MKNSINRQYSSVDTITTPLLLDTADIVINKKHRCKHCDKLLAIEHLDLLAFDVKCVRCGQVNSIVKDCERQVIITDKDGVILYVNAKVVEATGYSLSEVLGKTPAFWGGQMSGEFYKSMWDQISVQKKAIAVKVTNKHKDGHLYKVILRISPILDTSGNVELFIGMETLEEEVDNKIATFG